MTAPTTRESSSARAVTLISTGKPITTTADASAAAIAVRVLPARRRSSTSPGNPTARRAVDDVASTTSHDTEPTTVITRNASTPQPKATAMPAPTSRISASTLSRTANGDHDSDPDNAPQRCAYTAKLATPTASSTTDSARYWSNTWPLHSGDVAATMTASAAPIPTLTSNGRPRRVRVSEAARMVRVVSWSCPFCAPVTRPYAAQKTAKTAYPIAPSCRAARSRTR